MIRRVFRLDPFPQPKVVTTRYPVVLLHGFGVLGSIGKSGQQHSLAMNLRKHGVTAYAPNVAPYTTVPARAALWKERLQFILEETGVPRVNIIAHSMGGLDARFMISRLDGYKHVASLTTKSTPHRGS
jgi:triacylglycerol lipase